MMLASFGGSGKNPLQLMLMMLAPFGGFGKKPFAADAHDAGLVLSVKEKPLQLMLMMMDLFWGFGKNHCS